MGTSLSNHLCLGIFLSRIDTLVNIMFHSAVAATVDNSRPRQLQRRIETKHVNLSKTVVPHLGFGQEDEMSHSDTETP
jgi:hypothetical protein